MSTYSSCSNSRQGMQNKKVHLLLSIGIPIRFLKLFCHLLLFFLWWKWVFSLSQQTTQPCWKASRAARPRRLPRPERRSGNWWRSEDCAPEKVQPLYRNTLIQYCVLCNLVLYVLNVLCIKKLISEFHRNNLQCMLSKVLMNSKV